MAGAIAAQVKEIDPNQPVAEIRAMRDIVSADLAQPRFTCCSLAASRPRRLLLAAIGLYGVIAFGVTQRTREIGVRVALGAQHRDVLRLVMRRGMLLIGTGLAIGIAAALALGRIMTGLLYGVSPTDPIHPAGGCALPGCRRSACDLPSRPARRACGSNGGAQVRVSGKGARTRKPDAIDVVGARPADEIAGDIVAPEVTAGDRRRQAGDSTVFLYLRPVKE